MQFNLSGFTVTRCSVDFAFRLELSRPEQAAPGQKHATALIAGPFEYRANGTTLRLLADDHPQKLDLALALVRRTVEDSASDDDGALHLQLDSGASIKAPSLPIYEAWELTDGDGGRFVCMPGGKIATWTTCAPS